MYLLHQLGEFGVMCPIACTEGLVALIKQFPEDHTSDVKAILDHCTDGANNEFGIGAQFVSEIQGGSDIPANLMEVVWKVTVIGFTVPSFSPRQYTPITQ